MNCDILYHFIMFLKSYFPFFFFIFTNSSEESGVCGQCSVSLCISAYFSVPWNNIMTFHYWHKPQTMYICLTDVVFFVPTQNSAASSGCGSSNGSSYAAHFLSGIFLCLVGLQHGDGLFHLVETFNPTWIMTASYGSQCDIIATIALAPYLGAQRLMGLEHVQQFGIVNLQQHAGDLSRQVGMHGLNQREKTLTCLDKWRMNAPNKNGKSSPFIRYVTGHLPSICFCSWGGAAASMEDVRGSWPWTCTAGWA